MFNTKRVKELEYQIKILEKRIRILEEEKNLILNHLKIRVWEQPPIPGKKVVVSEEEYQKKMEAPMGGLGDYYMQQKAGMQQLGGLDVLGGYGTKRD